MKPRIVGTYEFVIFGNGIEKDFDLHLSALKGVSNIMDGQLPTGIKEVRLKGGATLQSTLEGETVHITFNIPPSSANIIVELLYGKAD